LLDIYIGYLPSPSVQLWAFIGMVLIIIDLAAMTGVLFFLGVGALITAVAIRFNMIGSFYGQLIWWGASSLIIGIIFWKRFKEIFGSKRSRSSSPPEKRNS
jgi:membrane protein implicated in regulation of membrane protease activity